MLYTITGDFTKITETSGTIQNTSSIYTIEMSATGTQDSGILIYPLHKHSFADTDVYLRCVDGGSVEVRVVPFELDAGGGGRNVADFSLDQLGTTVVNDFLFSSLTYPNAANPHLDGKTVLVMAVKDNNDTTQDLKYIFVDLQSLVDVYAAKDSSIGMSGNSIAVNISASSGNLLSLASDGLFVAHDSTKVDVVSGKQLSTEDYTTAEKTKLGGISPSAQVNVIEAIKIDGTTLTPDSLKAVDINLTGKVDTVAGPADNIVIFGANGAIADGRFSFAYIAGLSSALADETSVRGATDSELFAGLSALSVDIENLRGTLSGISAAYIAGDSALDAKILGLSAVVNTKASTSYVDAADLALQNSINSVADQFAADLANAVVGSSVFIIGTTSSSVEGAFWPED